MRGQVRQGSEKVEADDSQAIIGGSIAARNRLIWSRPNPVVLSLRSAIDGSVPPLDLDGGDVLSF